VFGSHFCTLAKTAAPLFAIGPACLCRIARCQQRNRAASSDLTVDNSLHAPRSDIGEFPRLPLFNTFLCHAVFSLLDLSLHLKDLLRTNRLEKSFPFLFQISIACSFYSLPTSHCSDFRHPTDHYTFPFILNWFKTRSICM
jgi:hypothetical protein